MEHFKKYGVSCVVTAINATLISDVIISSMKIIEYKE